MTLKSLRGFCQSLVHGIFINRHSFQLVGLILLELITISLLIFLRAKFDYTINFLLAVLFCVFFLAFDIGLLAYTINVNSEYLTEEKTVIYNFFFIILFLALMAVTILKMIINILIIIYKGIKGIRRKNKIFSEG